MTDAEGFVQGVLAGDRRAVAKTITLLESRRPDHVELGQQVLEKLVPEAGDTLRLGVSGAPGVGKSTFIETLGLQLIEKGHRIAVLAVDPSSPISGGSILGDKTRMSELAGSENAYIRPSPSGGTLGGVAHRTREAMLVCEAAGFDVVIVETVGVGQSEAEVASMVDFFAVLLQPGAGDELQGIKKGVLELADSLVVNKADGPTAALAERTQGEYGQALHLLRPRSESWTPRVLLASALEGRGIEEFWETVGEHRRVLRASGEFDARRQVQAGAWLWRLLDDGLQAAFRSHPAVESLLPDLEAQVARRETSAPNAARRLLDAFRRGAGRGSS
jgi:LAO/AO transport system kinase